MEIDIPPFAYTHENYAHSPLSFSGAENFRGGQESRLADGGQQWLALHSNLGWVPLRPHRRMGLRGGAPNVVCKDRRSRRGYIASQLLDAPVPGALAFGLMAGGMEFLRLS